MAAAAFAQATPATAAVVTVADTVDGGGMGAGTFYLLLSANGEATRTTALDETRRASCLPALPPWC